MLQKAEKRIYLSLSAPELVFWKEELQKLVLRQIKVVILTYQTGRVIRRYHNISFGSERSADSSDRGFQACTDR